MELVFSKFFVQRRRCRLVRVYDVLQTTTLLVFVVLQRSLSIAHRHGIYTFNGGELVVHFLLGVRSFLLGVLPQPFYAVFPIFVCFLSVHKSNLSLTRRVSRAANQLLHPFFTLPCACRHFLSQNIARRETRLNVRSACWARGRERQMGVKTGLAKQMAIPALDGGGAQKV